MNYNRELVFPLLAFALPLFIRAIPEVLMAPYVTGFDTMGHYIPTILLWQKNGVNLGELMATAPLFHSIMLFLSSTGVSLITIIKLAAPFLHGLLGLSVYGYAKMGLGWSRQKSLATTLLATVYFVSLRISWDLLRNELAIILLFVFLTLLSVNQTKSALKPYLLIALTMVFVVLAHQMVAALMFGIVGLTLIQGYFKKTTIKSKLNLLIVALPAILVFGAMLIFAPKMSEYRLIFGFPQNDGWLSIFGFLSYDAMLLSITGFFVYCFLPLLPFVILGSRHLRNFPLQAWVVLSTVGVLIPMVSPSNFRWVMLLVFPFSFFVMEALSRLQLHSFKSFKVKLHVPAAIYLLLMVSVLSFGFMTMPTEHPLFYFDTGAINSYVYHIPASMVQNTIPKIDCQDTINALQWLNSNMKSDSVLLSHRAFYGWSISNIDYTTVLLYEYDNPQSTAETVVNQGSIDIFLIWWIDGQGWYGQQSVASSFEQVYVSGKIAVYHYKI